MIIDSVGREIKLPIGDLKGTVCIARGNVFPDFRSNKCKSSSSLTIAYPKLILGRWKLWLDTTNVLWGGTRDEALRRSKWEST